MNKTFKQELELAEKYKINILKLNVANEVNAQLVNGYWWFEQDVVEEIEVTKELFEDVCCCVYNIYINIDNCYSLANVVEAVINLHMDEHINLSDIDETSVMLYITNKLI